MTTPTPQDYAPQEWRGLTANERDKVVSDLIDYGVDYVTPLYSEIERIEKLLQERNAAPQPGWLPISEAPKGRDVLLYSPRYLDLTIGDWRHYCRVNQPGFTHYQELPPPPSTKGEPT